MTEENKNAATTALIPLGSTEVIGTGPNLVQVLDVDKIFGDTSVYNRLPEEYRPQADELAEKVQCSKDGAEMTALRERGQASMQVLNDLGRMLTQDMNIDQADYVGDALRDVRDARDEINLELITEDPVWWRSTLMGLPWLGKFFNPVFRFAEGWESVDGKMDGWLEKLNQGYTEAVERETMLNTTKTGNLTSFRNLDIAVAGGEKALAREFQEFKAAVLANKDTTDPVTLQELISWRGALETLMLTLTRYHAALGRVQMNFPIIQQMITRTQFVKNDCQNLWETVLPQLRLTVGACIQNLLTRKAMKSNKDLVDLQQEMEQQLLQALEMAEEEEHELKMQAATSEAQAIKAMFEGLTALARTAAKHREEELKAQAEGKQVVLKSIDGFKDEMREILQEGVTSGIVAPASNDTEEQSS